MQKSRKLKKEAILCDSCTNSNCFVKQCAAEWISIIDIAKHQVQFKKGQSLFKEGDPVRGVYFIQKGKVKVISTGYNGRVQIVRLAKDGHILGHRGLGAESYPVGAIAMEDSLVCFLKNDMLNNVFLANPEFTIALMMFYSSELRKLEKRIKYMAQMDTRARVAEALLYFFEIFGTGKDKELNVTLSRRDLSSITGMSIEQVIRQLSAFEKENLIAKRGKQILLADVSALKKIVNDFSNQYALTATEILPA